MKLIRKPGKEDKLSESDEQYHTIRKINLLESRIAKKTSNQSMQYKNKDQLLIINSFVSWSDIKTLGLNAFT